MSSKMCPHDRLTAEPLTYYYGDNTNTNAIEIQIWCALIALLRLQVVHKEQKSKMAFSILAAIVRLHLMNYVSLSSVIETYKAKRTRAKRTPEKPPPKPTTPPPAFQMNFNLSTI